MREVFEIDFDGPQPFELPALVLASLAHPGLGEQEEKARLSLYISLCAWLIQRRSYLDPEWAAQPLPIKPMYLAWRESTISKNMRTFDRRMRDRLTAGHLAVAFLQQ